MCFVLCDYIDRVFIVDMNVVKCYYTALVTFRHDSLHYVIEEDESITISDLVGYVFERDAVGDKIPIEVGYKQVPHYVVKYDLQNTLVNSWNLRHPAIYRHSVDICNSLCNRRNKLLSVRDFLNASRCVVWFHKSNECADNDGFVFSAGDHYHIIFYVVLNQGPDNPVSFDLKLFQELQNNMYIGVYPVTKIQRYVATMDNLSQFNCYLGCNCPTLSQIIEDSRKVASVPITLREELSCEIEDMFLELEKKTIFYGRPESKNRRIPKHNEELMYESEYD